MKRPPVRITLLCTTFLITGFLIAASGAWWYVSLLKAETASLIDSEVAVQEADMQETLELLSRSGGNPKVAAIVHDCPTDERAMFDGLLSRLDAGLSTVELERLQALYNSCGDFFAVRRAVMAVYFSEEVERYEALLRLKEGLLALEEEEKLRLDGWQIVARKQTQISGHFSRLVVIQGEIIAELISGQRPGAPSIQALQAEAQDTQDTIGVLMVEVNTKRNILSDL